MLIKRRILVLLFLLTSCIKPISDRVAEQPATAKQPIEKLAYVADRALWLTTLGGTDKQKIDACPAQANDCGFTHLRWSPTGNFLLYLKYQDAISTLHWVDQSGKTRLLPGAGEQQLGLHIPVWSADGQSLIYTVVAPNRAATKTEEPTQPAVFADNESNVGDGSVQLELRITRFPFVEAGQKIGIIDLYGGCGGGGYPASERIYGWEGLGTFPFASHSLQLLWLDTDVLLYSRTCAGTGIGQFDLKSGKALPLIDKARLLSLTSNAARDQWAAITWDHHLAIGSAQAGLIATRPIADNIPSIEELGRLDRPGITLAGGVFYGATSGRLYYTTRQLQTILQIDEAGFNQLESDVMNLFVTYPRFPIYQTTLFATTQDDFTNAQIVWQGDAYGIGNVTESANGDLLFVRIDNGQGLYETLRTQQSLANIERAWPKPQTMRIPVTGGAPQVLIDNAGQVALTQIHHNK